MRPHATGDLETDPFQGPSHPNGERLPQAFAAGFYDGKVVEIDWSPDCCALLVKRMWKWARKQDKKLGKPIVYFHNGGKFDAHFILAELLKQFYTEKQLKLFCIGSRIVEIELPEFVIRDSYALIPKPLKAFSAKEEIDIAKLEPECREKHRAEITKYLRQDVVGLHEGLAEFFKLYGLGITLAGTAFKILGRDFGGKIARTSETYDARFRKAFFAGRVQFFDLGKFGELDGKKRFEIVDINSSFPYAMTKTHWFSDNYSLLEKVPKDFKEQCFYEVTCDSNGALPVRAEDNSVTFPVVKAHKFFVVGWELFNAINLGLVTKVKFEIIFMPDEVNDFSDYVNYFYELKKNAKTPAEREFAKLFLNAAYGKFAQDSRSFSDSVVTQFGKKPEPRLVKMGGKLVETIRKEFFKQRKKVKQSTLADSIGYLITANDSEWFILKGVEKKDSVYRVEYWQHLYDDNRRGLTFWTLPSTKEGEFPFNNVAVGASITAFARARLAEAMAKCKGVLYCDTDSILARDTSALEKSADKLGAWKTEKECDVVWIGGKKLYVAHCYKDLGTVKKPTEKFYREVHLPSLAFHRWYLTRKDFDSSWKLASKGVRLSVENLIAVCEGEERKYSFDAPNYSVKSAPHFTTRTVRRDDKRKRK